jgi:alpha-beta hydrolase superfamily lysophospholipase
VFASESYLVGGNWRMLLRPRNWDPAKPLILSGHGHSAAASGPYVGVPVPGYGARTYSAMLDAGFAVVLTDSAGGKSWGGAAAVTEYDAARTWAQSKLGLPTGPAHAFGFSMGGCLAATWAADNTDCLSLTLVCPALDLDYLYTNNYGGYAASEITAAYPGGYAELDPVVLAEGGAFDSIPTLLYHAAPEDTVVPLASVEAFAAASGAQVGKDVSPWVSAHSPDSITPEDLVEHLLENS